MGGNGEGALRLPWRGMGRLFSLPPLQYSIRSQFTQEIARGVSLNEEEEIFLRFSDSQSHGT
ncbi:MAG TPA: hypothetical protein VFU49_05980 [Ktedonobacteraceae bacterium]|nr:hypothetical protein [Ktedonobacteraceae bacterium]